MITTTHPFERAGLGLAPFRSVGIREITYVAYPGAPAQAGGTCHYCGTGIRYAVCVQSADNKDFIIGMDCAEKLYREDNAKSDKLLVAINDFRRQLEREKRHEREKRQLEEATQYLTTHRGALSNLPHPRHKEAWASNMTFADYVDWMWLNAGTSGKLRVFRMAKKTLDTL